MLFVIFFVCCFQCVVSLFPLCLGAGFCFCELFFFALLTPCHSPWPPPSYLGERQQMKMKAWNASFPLAYCALLGCRRVSSKPRKEPPMLRGSSSAQARAASWGEALCRRPGFSPSQSARSRRSKVGAPSERARDSSWGCLEEGPFKWLFSFFRGSRLEKVKKEMLECFFFFF